MRITSKVRTGLTPAVNALVLIAVAVTVIYEVKRRRILKSKGIYNLF